MGEKILIAFEERDGAIKVIYKAIWFYSFGLGGGGRAGAEQASCRRLSFT